MTTKLNARIGEVTERIVRAQPADAPGLPRADRRGHRQQAGPQTPRLRQFRPWLRRLRSGRQGGVARGDGPNLGDRHRLQRHALGASALRPLSRSHQGGGARRRRDGAGRGRRAGDVRRRHPGREGHGAFALLPRRHRALDRGRPLARHVRRGGLSRHLRQDRARPPDRRPLLRPSAGGVPARRDRCPPASPTTRNRRSASCSPKARRPRDELLEAEAEAYHSPGTCTFYGTANTNQMLMEIMGLHLPGASFVNPNTPLRDALTMLGVEAGAGDHRARQRVRADRAHHRRASDRQRRRRAARHRRLDQPHHPSGRDGGARRASR